MNQQTPLNSHTHDCNGQVDFTRKNIIHHPFTFLRKQVSGVLLVFGFIMLGSSPGSLWAQSSTCVPGMVGNSSSSPWSEECYLNNSCGLQGNPCQAGDVSLLGVFIADDMGGPVPACNVGEEVEVLLWGTFNNSTNSARYAVRTRTEIFINGEFLVELIGCSFDVMGPGATDVALLGTFTYTCGDQVQLVNTWIGWDTNQAQCSDSGAPNYDNVCGEYPPSKCSRDFDTISFLTPNFDYFCGLITTTTTEVCFTNATIGGTPPYTYFWEFGDGGTSTLENPCHTFVGTTGSYTVTLTVTDADSTQAGAVLEVDLDSLDCCDMTVICPPADGGLFSCIADIPAADTDLITVTDSCGPVVITFEDDITGTGCGTDTMFVIRSYFISDGSNLDTCVQTFAAVDDVGPQLIGCPGDITVECANLVPVQSLDGIDADDNCSGGILLSLLPDVVSDSTCANRYVITRTYVATDACNNTSTCEQLITVFDDTEPEFNLVPIDTSILCDADTVFGVPAVMDNCGGVVTLDSVTNFFPTVTCAGGSIVRTWTATDACGNTSSADQAIFLIDTLDPVFIFEPADTSIACDETPVFGTPEVEDNCDVDVTVTSEVFTAPTVNCAGGTTTIVWTATDNCGNTATASQVITFIDTLDPVFTFIPNDSTIACGETPVFGVPIVTDNCDTQVSVTADTVTLTGLCGDTSIVTWTATDNCNNTSTAQQTIFEVDLLAPSITCPPDATLECNVPTDPNTSIPGEATAEDNCDATPTVTFSDVTVASLTCAVGYTITRTWTATDDCGNSTTCIQMIEVVDTTPPALTCPIDITIECTDPIIPDSTGLPIVLDNCDTTPTVTFIDVTMEGICPQAYFIERTWTAVDTCGNDTTCVQLISVVDTTGPVMICPADTIVDCTAAVDTAALGVAMATDNCGGSVTVTFNDNIIPGSCEQEYTINRTWLAVDECLNRTTCLQVIMVQDTLPPVFDTTLCETNFEFFTSEGSTCPAESVPSILLNVALGIPIAVDETWTVGNNIIPSFEGCLTDNCADPDSFNILPSSFQVVGDSCDLTMIVTFFIQDNCGNALGEDIVFTVTIHDDVAPVITCPENVTVECDDSTLPDSTGFATAVDECIGLVGISFADSIAAGDCPNEMIIFRTWTADDSCGNTSSCVQLIFVEDNTGPMLTCPDNITIECTDSTEPDSTGFPTVVDNCDPTPEVTFMDATVAGNCPSEYSIVRSWTAIDTCGNISTCVQNIFVEDNTPPEITCPDNLTIECDDSTLPDSTGVAIATDNCDPTPEVTIFDTTVEGGCPQAYQIIRVWTAMDTCGNINTCTQLISVVDTTGPVLTCPPDATLDCDVPTGPNSTVPGMATATDNCDPAPLVTSSDVTAAGSCPQEYTITRTWLATDACLNTSTCVQIITVQDTLAPVITCPADTLIDCSSGTLPGITGRATAIDNCDPSVTPDFEDAITEGSCPQEYTITRTWTATDSCQNVSTCVQIIMVQDTTAPVITCPADTIIDCTASTLAESTGLATATDNCDTLVEPTFVDVIIQGLCPQGYTIERTWTAIDDCLNSSTCVQIISVQDTLDPVLVCPADTLIDCASDTSPDVLGMATATDNCDTLVLVNSVDVIIPSTVCPSAYTILRTWTAVDDCLNRTTCLQTITVQDTTAPVIICPADTIVDCDADVSPDLLGFATATDNCTDTITPTFVDEIVAGQCPQSYTITRTWTATDSCFNSSTCVQIISVQDTVAPVIVCPADTIIDCTADSSPDVLGSATATDNCDAAVLTTFVDATIAGDCPQEYTIERTWTATDSCFNSSTCIQIISVQDTLAPVITCPADTIIDCTSITLPEATGSASASDNCDTLVTPTFADVTIAGDCAQEYTIERTWTAVDDCLNESTCLQIISVQDTAAPLIVCPVDTIIDCTASSSPDDLGFAIATDNCDTMVLVNSVDVIVPSTICPSAYTILRTWTAVDDCLNTTTCLQTIIVQDTTAPVIVCPADTIVDCDADVSPDLLGFATATDNCTDTITPTFVDEIVAGQCPQEYTIMRTWTATDSCFNSSTCVQIISVQDTVAPVIVCPVDTIIDCTADSSPDVLGSATATDNCDAAVLTTFVDATIAGDCPQEYTIERTWTATDSCFNSSTCLQIISVQDTVAPVIVCPADTIIDCLGDTSPDVLGVPDITDNCDPEPLFDNVDVTIAGDCPQEFTIERTWTVSDACGNSSTCLQIISVQDTIAPAILCPMPLVLDCSQSTSPDSTGFATAIDNCDTLVVPDYSDQIIPLSCVDNYLILRTWTAIDDCENSTSCTQILIIQDLSAPVMICPADTIVDCDSDLSPESLGFPDVTDNCTDTIIPTFADAIIPGQCPNSYTIQRLWTATDSCNNLSSCVQIISVQDTTAPVITCPADTIIDCTASISPDSLGVAVAIDACDGPVLTTFLDATMAGECPQEYTITRTWVATDSCFNSSTCVQTITVQDTTAPVIICPADTIIDCTGNTSPDVLGVPDVTDNCDAEPLFDNVDVTIAGECPQEYTIERTWTATDACGNSSTCLQIITVQDTVPPAITCPLNVTIECTDSIEPDSTGGPALAADLCDPTPEVTFSDATVAGECPQEYTITRTWVATDSCGNSSSCDQLIFVQDNTPPVMTCPADLTIDCDANTLPDSTGLATAVDNCDEDPEVTYQDVITGSQTCVQEYIINRLWIATDSCGNASSCTQVIFVQDTTPPVATFIPPDVTVECDTLLEAILAEPPVFDDNCDTLVEAFASIEVVQNEGCPYTNTYIIGWSGVDDCGNQTIVTRTVVEVDTTAPVVICPPDVTLDCLDDTSTETNGFAEVTDNCDPEPIVTSADVTIAGECPQEYTIERTWTASDACGNSSTCLQVLTVVDTVPPAIICPADLIFECVSEVPEPNTEEVIATDSCGGVTITFVEDIVSDSTCVNRLIINRVYQAEDDCGNTSTCTQIIDVFDDTPPTLLCPAGITVQCAAQVPAPSTLGLITSDNCEGAITVAHVSDATVNMTCINRFDVIRTYSATDACGNSSTCTQTITVFDNTPPVITCPANLTVQCASQVPAPNIAGVTVTDNCAGTNTVVFVGDVISNMTCVNRFTVTRTYRATDACGNSATCAQIITVFDNTPPMITCPANLTVQCAAQVPAPNIAQVTVTDNCTGTNTVTHVSDVITNMTCVNRFTLTRTYRATDACGNSATCTQVITVFDNTAPTITFNDPLLEGVPNGGTVEVQCFGQDPNWTIPTFGAGDVIATDNCAGNVTVVLTDELVDEGDCDVDGYINRYRFTWTATDACGNSSTAFVFMNLIDTIPPVIQGIPEDITVNCDEIPEPPTNIMATDECLCACVIEFEQSVPAPGCQNGQVITRTWTAEDDCGNVTIEVQNITLIDTEGPEIVVIFPGLEGVENGTIFEYTCNEGGIPEFWDDVNGESVTTIFSCGTAGIVSFDPSVHIANNCKFWGYVESRTYTWEAVDQCGNVSTFSIIVRLIDTEGPQFINIPEMTCVDDPALALIDIIDNCENAKFTYWDTKIPNPCGEGEALRRTYEAWDDCGNYSRDTVILIPNDKIRPIMEFNNQDLIDIGFGEVLIVECNLAELGQYTPYGPQDVTVVDGCMGELQVVFTERIIESGDCNDGVLAVMQLVWMAMDICGNRSELVINAHLVDHTAPDMVDFEVDVTIDCNDDMPELFAVDNCGEVTITTVDSIIPGACKFEYDVLRRITVSDPCGNTTERLQIVRVGDGQGPDIAGVEEEVCDDLSIPEVTAYDPCAGEFVGVTMQEDTLDVPCRDGFVVERIWTAVDACGNVSEVRQLIIIGDQTPPEILIPSGSVIRLFDFFGPNHVDMSEANTFKRLQALDDNSVYAKDDCDQEITPVLTLDVTISDNCEEDGYYEHRVYTWVVEDACGNSDSFSFEVDVMDDIPPVLSTIPEDTIVVCDDLPAPPVITAEDYADDVTVTYEEVQIPGDGPGVFVVIRTWTATDPCGNVSQASQNIQWIPTTLIACDILMPEIVDCNSHGVVIGSEVSGGLGEVTYMWEITGEKCFIQSGQNTPEITIYVGFSEVEISLTVTDAFGCSNVCTATLDCLDPIVADFNAEQDPTVPFVVEGPAVQNSNDLLDILKHFNMWPNPASASVNISFESTIEHDTRIVLVNYLGQTVYENTVRAIKGFNSHKVNVAHLPEGSYMVQLISEKAMESKMLVLVRNK